jgi:MFS family permease
MFLISAFKEPQYVTLIGAVFLMIMGVFIPIFYLPTYAVAHGFSTELAFYLTAILNAASFFGRVIPGITADKVGRFNMLCVMGISTGILSLCWQKITTHAGIIVFAILYGFTSGAIVSLMAVCFAQIPKNPKNIGTYMGMGMLVASCAALIGPPVSGALVNHYHSFKQVSIFSGVVSLAGGFGVLFVKFAGGEGFFTKI